MSVFSISDLHLSESVNKPMDIFGCRWQSYRDKIVTRWRAVVSDSDTVVVPGDISWALTLEESAADMQLIDSLPGRKLIGKGNHDYWWGTMTKMKSFFFDIGVTSVDFLYNNAFEVEDYIICGTRGWYVEERLQNTTDEVDYAKIVNREAMRLKMSLDEAERLRGGRQMTTLVYFHFPPVFREFVCRELVDVLHEYDIHHCYFGHIHGQYNVPRTVEFEGISMTMISADFLDFIPMITCPVEW